MVALLEETAQQLKSAWESHLRAPDYYPMNAEIVLAETKAKLRGEPEVVQQGPIKLPSPPQPPQSFSDLLDEKLIESVYEDQNSGSYADALKQAGSEDDEKAWLAFRKILKAIEGAYASYLYGYQGTPTPKVHFLHRNLLEVADLAGLSDLTHEGLLEFFDDLCPCGKQHNLDALRKLRKRLSNKTHSLAEDDF
jgi:hypothetical protein